MGIVKSLKEVREKIHVSAFQAGRDSNTIKLIAVTKTVELTRILEAVDAGILFLGENRVLEAREKIQQIKKKRSEITAEWHLVGNLQRNKAKTAIQIFDLIHSVDSVKLAEEIEKQARRQGKLQRILLQVKLSVEPSKHGITENNLFELLEWTIRSQHIQCEGLMTIPPFSEDPEEARPFFRRLRQLADLYAEKGFPLKELSMGMSNDYEIAIQEGASMVRIGTAIFGERDYETSY
jgi:pyridoxal phosphate enzyme (YggS family)